jgi:ATP-dependent RNA helicase RhlE
MDFKSLNLNKFLWNALDDLGFKEPTLIQERTIPVIMSGKDVVGIAQTGTGKTFAYLLPILRQWNYAKHRFPQTLILVPTRELVAQVVDAVHQLTKYMSIQCVGVFGGVNINTQAMQIINGVDIIVATPGRLMDLALNGSLNLKYINRFVIDEMDEMLNLGFRTQLLNVLDMLPEKRQNLLFSATLISEVEEMIETFFNAPIRVEAAPSGTPLRNIEQVWYNVPNYNTKRNFLVYLLDTQPDLEKVLIFTGSKKMADELFEQLYEIFDENVGVIHSNKAQNNRFNTVKKFHEGKIRFLIATDIVARGLDISQVTHVINIDIPEVPENFIHRIGRTGRADHKGQAIAMVAEYEIDNVRKIENLMGFSVQLEVLPEGVGITDVLTLDEMPETKMKTILIKPLSIEERGPAFHEKKEKNLKTNNKVRFADKMKAKYGKPKTRGQKPRGKK